MPTIYGRGNFGISKLHSVQPSALTETWSTWTPSTNVVLHKAAVTALSQAVVCICDNKHTLFTGPCGCNKTRENVGARNKLTRTPLPPNHHHNGQFADTRLDLQLISSMFSLHFEQSMNCFI